jgi:hypothetical protein
MKYYEKCGVTYDFENFREFRFLVSAHHRLIKSKSKTIPVTGLGGL